MRLWLLFLLATLVGGSSGDDREEFKICVRSCLSKESPPNATSIACDALKIPFERRIFGWNCEDECRYDCMHFLTSRDTSTGLGVHQYFGKWPFVRFGGIQEPASVLFSLGNFWMHWNGIRMLLSPTMMNYPFRWSFCASALFQMNAWLWSSVFHCRDLPWTERMDYFGAMAAILGGLFAAVHRVTHAPLSSRFLMMTSYLLFLYFLAHCYYLSSRPRFDYSYNMKAGIVIGLVHNLLWISWAIYNRTLLKHAWMCVLGVVWIMAAMSLEVLDFPPWWGVFDAHSLWHLATIPAATIWYRFIKEDIRFMMKQSQ